MLLITGTPRATPAPAPGQPGTGSDYVPGDPDLYLALTADGEIYAFSGHVDLGTGVRTALGQLVAEELDVAFEQVMVLLGHTELAPNQGPTIASMTIQVTARPLRRAAAQAREFLRARFGAPTGAADSRPAMDALPELRGLHIELPLDDAAPLKSAAQHRIVGRSVPRVDIPAKATGVLTFVHDLRLPGLWHARVVRPPHPGRDAGGFVGRSLRRIDEASIAGVPGARVVVIGDFVAVAAPREEHAELAARRLRVTWQPAPGLEDFDDVERALRRAPARRRVLLEEGDLERAMKSAAHVLERTYLWPYQLHASIGPSCAVADHRAGRLTVWSGTQNPHSLRIDLSRLLEIDEGCIEIVRMEASGCYGRNCADDVAADAALLSRSLGRPVRVQLTRQQEHLWEPKGAAQLMDVTAAVGPDGALLAYEFATRYPSNDAPTLALLLTGRLPPVPRVFEMGDRTAVPPYGHAARRIVCHDLAPLIRSSWLRGVSALPNCFAHESMMDELAESAGADPVEFRLRHLSDARASDLIRRVAAAADWATRGRGSRGIVGGDARLRGRGFGYARYVHSRFPGVGAAWSAWAVELSVEPVTGAVIVQRLVVGQDTGLMVNPEGVRHQIHGNVIQTLSRVLCEEVTLDPGGVTARDWGSYSILGFMELPDIEVILMERPTEEPLGAGESASVPGPAAVANALFDATGVRFRRPPFTPDKILAGLAAASPT